MLAMIYSLLGDMAWNGRLRFCPLKASYETSKGWERLDPFEPMPKMLTFLPHSLNAHGSRCQRALDDFSIGGVNRNYTFGRRGLGTIIDVLWRWKIIPNLTEAMREVGLIECLSEGIWIAK